MKRHAMSAVIYLLANAVGLLLAALLLPGFRIGIVAFVVVVLVFCVIHAIARPVISKIATRKMPELMGGISLVTVFLGLFFTALLVSDMDIGGISNWLAATLLVWIGSLVATVAIPRLLHTAPHDPASPSK